MSTAATTTAARKLRLEDIERIAKEIEAMPKGKWMLVSPDCHYWQSEDIREILKIAAQHAYGVFRFDEAPLWQCPSCGLSFTGDHECIDARGVADAAKTGDEQRNGDTK